MVPVKLPATAAIQAGTVEHPDEPYLRAAGEFHRHPGYPALALVVAALAGPPYRRATKPALHLGSTRFAAHFLRRAPARWQQPGLPACRPIVARSQSVAGQQWPGPV